MTPSFSISFCSAGISPFGRGSGNTFTLYFLQKFVQSRILFVQADNPAVFIQEAVLGMPLKHGFAFLIRHDILKLQHRTFQLGNRNNDGDFIGKGGTRPVFAAESRHGRNDAFRFQFLITPADLTQEVYPRFFNPAIPILSVS